MPKVLYEKRGALAYVTLNRPEVHNCIDLQMSEALLAIWDEVKRDRDVRVAILTGAGEKAFCSGADLKELIPHIRDASEEENRRRAFQGPGWAGISGGYEISTPIIAAINGYCIAGGHELAEFCDIRIAAEHATFGHQEIKWGLMPGDGGCSRLQRIVGLGRAMEIILTGKIYDAQEAYRIGFANHVVPLGSLIAKATEMAEQIAGNGPLATRAAKQAVLHSIGRPLREGIAFETDTFSYLCRSEDWLAGQQAFLTRSTATFKGK
ncbi:MAG: enoyl-CoA hydratase/isomerase family protein [Candidatus Rokubacteria bacterium]|nr:enoyl-CoA hydratase/isomerase family protein [Candidatus Rokubacteria bacterium]